MRRIRIGDTAVVSAALAFGTSRLHQLRAAQRERLLRTAFEHGITHYDTSPYYGFGIAERSLAVFAHEPTVTVASKVGLYPPGGADQPAVMTFARKVIGRLWPRCSRPIVDLTVSRARASLTGSLRRLKRDRIDLLLLHEPQLQLLGTEEWRRWLEDERTRVGCIGVSGEPAHVAPFVTANTPFAAVIQTRDSLAGQEAEPLRTAGHAPHITFGHLIARPASQSATAAIRGSLRRFPATVVLVSAREPERLAQLVRAADGA